MEGVYINQQWFASKEEAARCYQHWAYLRYANSRRVRSFHPLVCAAMQRQAANMAATARELMGVA